MNRFFYQGCTFVWGCKLCGYFNREDFGWGPDGSIDAIKKTLKTLKKGKADFVCLRCQQEQTCILHEGMTFDKETEPYWDKVGKIGDKYGKRYQKELLARRKKNEKANGSRGRGKDDGSGRKSSDPSKVGKGGEVLSEKLQKLRAIRLRRGR